MSSTGSWCLTRADAVADVVCGGSVHRIRWSRGKLVLDDHRLGDEELLVTLGAPETGCVAVLGAWRRRELSRLPAGLVAVAHESEELTRWRRSPAPPLLTEPEQRYRALTTRRLRAVFGRSGWAHRRGRHGRGDIAVLVSFDDAGPPRVSSWGDLDRPRTVEGVEVTVHSRWCTRVPPDMELVDGTVVLGLVDGPRPCGEPTPVWVAAWADGGLRARATVARRRGGGWSSQLSPDGAPLPPR